MSTITVASGSAETHTSPRIHLDPADLRDYFDREPFAFTHNLSGLDLFKMDSLHALCLKIADARQDYFIQAGAPSPEARFFSIPTVAYKPHEAIENLDRGSHRLLIKRAENHDKRFRDLIHDLFRQVVESLGGLGKQKVVRLESGLLISTAATITSFHYDPEIAFFSQIEGEKIYHAYSPSVVEETEVERFAICGPVSLAPLSLEGRDRSRDHVFHLKAGKGFHQPQNAPHWVETGATRSVSYTFVFETDVTRAKARTRAFNHYLRKLHIEPARVGAKPGMDTFKAGVMRAMIPLRSQAAIIARKLR